MTSLGIDQWSVAAERVYRAISGQEHYTEKEALNLLLKEIQKNSGANITASGSLLFRSGSDPVAFCVKGFESRNRILFGKVRSVVRQWLFCRADREIPAGTD